MRILSVPQICLMACLLPATFLAQSGLESLTPQTTAAVTDAKSDGEPPQKIAPAVRAKAESGETVWVLISLSDNAPSEALEQIRAGFRNSRAAAEKRTRDLAKSSAPAARAAAADRDALIRAERAALARTSAAAYRPQQERFTEYVTTLGGRVLRRLDVVNLVEAQLPPAALLALASHPEVVRVVENKRLQPQLVNSTRVMGAPVFWEAGFTGGTQTVAVIDSGIAADHIGFSGISIDARYELQSAAATGCTLGSDTEATDQDGHGTHVAGIIASQGIASAPTLKGVAFGLAQLISIRVGSPGNSQPKCPDTVIQTSDILAAVATVATETAAKVVNISIGGPTAEDDGLANWVIDMVADQFDIVFTIAAGNAGTQRIAYQLGDLAISYNGITVANLDTKGTLTKTDDEIFPSSSRGPTRLNRKKPDIAAPGTNIVSLAPGSSKTAVKADTGTSMAAPHVAGAAALLLDAGVKGAKEVKALMLNSADGAGWARDSGFGAANLGRAANQIASVVSGTVPSGQSMFYRAKVAGQSRMTLVWNRHIDTIVGGKPSGDFRNLNLAAYDEPTNRLVASSASTVDNVEQLNLTGTGTAIVKVSHLGSDRATESYAIAFPSEDFEAVAGPRLSVSCTGDSEVAGSMKVAVRCTARNTGALALYGITVRVLAPTGFNATVQPIPSIGPGVTVPFGFDLTTTSQVGLREYAVVVEGSAFGDLYGERIPMTVMVTAIKPQDCTMVVTPPSGSMNLTYTAQSFVIKIAFPRYDPKQPGTCSYDAFETGAWFSLGGAKRGGPAGGEIIVNVNQANRNTLYANRTGTFRLATGVPYVFTQNYQK